MNATVAVALITSLSTLTAAGLAGMASAWVTGRQLRHQQGLANDEREERRAVGRRDMRREAYEQFLSRSDAAYRVLDEGWFAQPFTGLPRWEAGFAARRALDEAHIRVQLAGPEDVVERAADIVRRIGDEFRLHARIVNSAPAATGSAAERDSTARAESLRARFVSSAEFLTTARRALGNETPAGPASPGRADATRPLAAGPPATDAPARPAP